MNSRNQDKATVVVVYGHGYTFFSNGIYLCSELSGLYNIVLVMPKTLSEDERFHSACNILSISEVVYYPTNTFVKTSQKDHFFSVNFFKQYAYQVKYSTIGRTLFEKYDPVAVIQHDYINIENMYFFHWARVLRDSCSRIVVLSTAPSNDRTLSGFEERRRERAVQLGFNSKLLGCVIAFLFSVFKLLDSVLRNIVLPLIILRRSPYFGLSIFDNIDLKPRCIQFDHFMVFERSEVLFYSQLFGDDSVVKRIRSPISSANEVNKQLFSVAQEKGVVIFFSLTSERGFDSDLLDRWCALLKLVSERFPDCSIVVKDHPGMSFQMSSMRMKYIQERCGYVKYITSDDLDVKSESLILDSWLVIGDSSSLLPWAVYCGGKVVLSMDIEGSVNSRDMESYSGITVFSRNDNFVEVIGNIEKARSIDEGGYSLPSICDFID